MDAAVGTTKRVVRPRPEPTPPRAPIQYRLPKPEDLGKPEKELPTDYAPLVLASSHAALALFVTQALSSVLLANYFGAVIEIRFVGNIIPYLSMAVARQSDLLTIVSVSSALSVVAVCVGTIQALIRLRGDPLSLNGWATGLPMGAFLLGFQYLRHLINPPVVNGWILAQAGAGLVTVTVLFIGFKPTPIPTNTPNKIGNRRS